ncbi:MAG: SO2930 family diheme c-type cytochrome [Pseudomonadota bacterium]
MRFIVALLTVFTLAGCADEKITPRGFATENPDRLSAWGMFDVDAAALRLSDGVAPYDLATPLFSDYAQKLRTVWTPEGAPAIYNATQAFDFPVGTVVTKTFYYPVAEDGAAMQAPSRTVSNGEMALDNIRLLETRILVRRADGWHALPYIWNAEQTDAVLKRTGDIIPTTLLRDDGRRKDFAYIVPNANQCAACHATNATTKEIQPIGLKARHLNKSSAFAPAFNQLDHWIARGALVGDVETPAPRNAVWTDADAPVAARARAYLDINCSHCHNPRGAADTSGLNLEPDAAGPALGLCKAPIAAGRGTGGRAFGIVPGAPERSITHYRMATTDPAAMMPELGRALAHEEGVALIGEWIAAMDGGCG